MGGPRSSRPERACGGSIQEETLTGLGASNTVIAEMARAAGRGVRRFKRVEYERLAECGFFYPTERLELIDGLMLMR